MKKAVIALIIVLLFTTGCSIKKVQELSNSEKFAKEFEVSTKNPFVYTNIDHILNLLENGTGIIFFANSDYEGSKKAAIYITKIAKQENIKNVYYYNPKRLKEKKPKKYKKLIGYLDKCIDKNNMTLPDIYAVKNGKIISHSTLFSRESELSEDYLSKKRIRQIEEEYRNLLTYKECSNCC
ncbi:MAG: hypothetical protein HFJ12_03375 [Bacilli bacterium]|nr:hypothetical protein [Bacilli bacterium]